MNILSIVEKAYKELGLTPVPNTVVGSNDPQVNQFVALAEACGDEWVTDFQWQRLNKEHTFMLQSESQTGSITSGSPTITGLSDTSGFAVDDWQIAGSGIPTNARIQSIDSASQVTMNMNATETSASASLTFTQTKYDLPSDWNYQVDRTHWDRTNNWEMIGPKLSQERQWLKSGIVSTGPRIRYWLQENKFQIWPIEVNQSDLVYEYISDSWIISSGSTTPTKKEFTADTDSTVFRDRLMIAAIKYKFFASKGFDTTIYSKEYKDELSKAKAQAGGNPTLSMSPKRSNILISPANVPDGSVFGR